jgi:hypothetical protein
MKAPVRRILTPCRMHATEVREDEIALFYMLVTDLRI